jgi:hypothetical protein
VGDTGTDVTKLISDLFFPTFGYELYRQNE